MILNLPAPVFSPVYLTNLVTTLRRAFINVLSSTEGAPRVILISPNKTNWSVTVADDGTISAAVNDGKTTP